MALPDITSAIAAHWPCVGDASHGIITDVSGNGLDLTVTSDNTPRPFPQRSAADGQGARLFSRAGTSGTGAVPSNYAQRAIGAATLDAMVGSGNGNNGEHTIAVWMRRTPTGLGEGTGQEVFLYLGGTGLHTASAQDLAVASAIVQMRSAGGLNRWKFLATTAAGAGTPSFTSAIKPGLSLDGKWVHIVFVVRANVAGTSMFVDLYKNGVYVDASASLAGSAAFVGSALPTNAVIAMSNSVIGGTDTAQTAQVGAYVRHAMVYSRALAAADVAALFASQFVDAPGTLDTAHTRRP